LSKKEEAATAESANPCAREISIEIPADVVAKESEALLAKYQKLARLPGFRKGKAPASLIRSRFGDDLRSELVESLVPRYFREAVEKQRLEPVSQPHITDLHIHEGEPLRFTAKFEVLPPIEVAGYKELRADKQDTSVTEDEVAKALNHMREQRATFVPVEERTLADGDFAQISFQSKAQSVPSEKAGEKDEKPVTVDDILVEVGGANTVRDFSDNLRGAAPGDERRFDVKYPDDFGDERLRGRTVNYTVSVKAIKRKELPGLDDAFAAEAGEFKSLEELKQRIRESLEKEKSHRAEHEAKEKLLDELVKRNEFPVPEALIERQVSTRLERGLRALAAQGLRAEDMKKMDLERLRAGQRDAARKEVQASLLLEKIADVENIHVGEDEVAREIEALAAQTQQTPEAIRARLTRDGALDRIRDRMRNEKALQFLYSRPA
jgi:trigger factor